MNIVTRLANIFRGFLSLFVSDLERQNPEVAYENAINSMVAKFDKARNAVAAIIAERQQTERRLSAAQTELTQVDADLNAALATDQDDLAEMLVQKQEQLQATITGFTNDLKRVSAEAESAKALLTSFKGDIERLKSEKNTMLARHQTAKARVAIQDQLDGLSVDAEVRALNNVRDGINQTVAKADLNAEIAGTDVDARLAKLRQNAGSISAKAKVQAMKAARTEAQNKTL